MKAYFKGIFGIVQAYQLRFLRDKVALFFTFLFPLIFLFVFGTIFGNSDPSFKIALFNNSDSSFARGFVESAQDDEAFNISDDIANLDDAKERMSRGEIDSIIVLPKEFGQPGQNNQPSGELDVYYRQGAEQSGQTVAAIMEGILSGINRDMGQPEPNFTVNQVAARDNGLSTFDYTFSGLLGFTILSSAIFGLANVMPAEKQRGSYRRLRAAPFKSSQLIIGNMMHFFIISAASALLMIVVGIVLFDFEMRGSWLQFGLFASFATIMMLGFGLLIGGWARNESQAAPLSNLIAFPMMFLSGIFFPRFLFPEWLQGVTSYIPLSPVIDGFRLIMTENANLFELGSHLLVIAIWTIAIYILAIKLFRWE